MASLLAPGKRSPHHTVRGLFFFQKTGILDSYGKTIRCNGQDEDEDAEAPAQDEEAAGHQAGYARRAQEAVGARSVQTLMKPDRSCVMNFVHAATR